MTYFHARRVDGDFETVAQRTREALGRHGFGVLTEIDVQTTLKTKIDVDMEDYLILGACNPPSAYRAVSAEKQIGLLLPCNVVVRRDPDDVDLIHVEAMNPQLMVNVVPDNPGLIEVADEVAVKLQAVIDAL